MKLFILGEGVDGRRRRGYQIVSFHEMIQWLLD
jgi:hypothetical protein